MEVKTHILGDIQVPIHMIPERRRSARVAFGTEAILLRFPRYSSKSEKDRHLNWAIQWLEKLYDKRPKVFERYRPILYQNGSTITTAYKSYELHITQKDRKTIKGDISGQKIFLTTPLGADHQMMGKAVSRALAKDQLNWIEEKVRYLNQKHFGEKIKNISLRNANTRWGSCNSNGNISISTRCLLAPEPIIDHIIIHELAHLKEMNHSDRFWRWVEKALPDYKKKEAWLKKYGYQLRF